MAPNARDHVRILLVEDNPTTAKTLVVFLSAEGYAVECAYDGRNGERAFRSGNFDLVVLDLMLPDMDGLSVCRAIRQCSATPVVVLTAKTTVDDIVEGLECGADDYVCKPFESRELLARIRRCLQRSREETGDDGIFRVGVIQLDPTRRSVTVSGELVKLTRSEFDILHVLMRRPGRVFTRNQLIELALGPDFDGFDRTVDTHIWSLRRKIGEAPGRPRYILSELGVGYRMSEPDAG